MVANFYTKHIVLIHPTVMSDGIEARNIGRVQSLRRSLRSSLRRRSTSASAEERRKIAASLNLEIGVQGGGAKNPPKKRAYSADASLAIEDTGPIINTTVPPEQQGFVCHLIFAETHISGKKLLLMLPLLIFFSIFLSFYWSIRWWSPCQYNSLNNGIILDTILH